MILNWGACPGTASLGGGGPSPEALLAYFLEEDMLGEEVIVALTEAGYLPLE